PRDLLLRTLKDPVGAPQLALPFPAQRNSRLHHFVIASGFIALFRCRNMPRNADPRPDLQFAQRSPTVIGQERVVRRRPNLLPRTERQAIDGLDSGAEHM